MNEYTQVQTKADLATLDDNQVLEGYLSAIRGNTNPPGNDKTRSYWHGWRNGMADKGMVPVDSAMRNLAKDAHDECVGTMELIYAVFSGNAVH